MFCQFPRWTLGTKKVGQKGIWAIFYYYLLSLKIWYVKNIARKTDFKITFSKFHAKGRDSKGLTNDEKG